MSNPTSNTYSIEADSLSLWDATSKSYVDIKESIGGAPGDIDAQLALKRDIATSYSSAQVDTALAAKRDVATSYSSAQVDTALAAKRDVATSYSKDEVDTALNAKQAEISLNSPLFWNLDMDHPYPMQISVDTYSTSQIVSALALKADKGTTFTKTEVTSRLATKQDTLVFKTPTSVYGKALGYDYFIKGIEPGLHLTLSDSNDQLMFSVSEASLANSFATLTALGLKANATDVTNGLATKRDLSTSYSRTEVDTLLGARRLVSDSYSISQIDTALLAKRNVTDSYDKATVDGLLYDKQAKIALTSPLFWTLNMSVPYEIGCDSYTKSYVDGALAAKANLASPSFTGTSAFSAVTASGAVTCSSTLNVGAAATCSTTLNVTGATTCSATLNVSGAATFSSTLNVTGAATFASFLAPKPWVGFLVTTSGGTASISNHVGYKTTGISVSHTANGNYTITIPAHPDGAAFLTMLSPYSTSSGNTTTYPTGYTGNSTTIFVYCRSDVGVTSVVDGNFYVHTVP